MSHGKRRSDLVRGTLDLMILRTLELRPLHGIAVADRIRQLTQGTFNVPAGSLFPALYRLEERGWLTSMPGGGGTHPRAKLYKLTQAGRKQIAAETASWSRVVKAIARVIEETS